MKECWDKNLPGFLYKNVNDYDLCHAMAFKLGLPFSSNAWKDAKKLKTPLGCNLVTNIEKRAIGNPSIVYFNSNITLGKRERYDKVTPFCTLWRIKN